MGKKFEKLEDSHIEFISKQKIFFVGTAGASGRVNISPKGLDSFKVLGPNEVMWLNLTGSGNESSTHVQEINRMTLMFMALEGKPMILRLYGDARVYHSYDEEWEELLKNFPENSGARQVFKVVLNLVQVSCGYAVPLFEYQKDRTILTDWSDKLGEAGIKDYWAEKNTQSIDGTPTQVLKP